MMNKIESDLKKLLVFYSVLGRPIDINEILALLPNTQPDLVLKNLNKFKKKKAVIEEGGFFISPLQDNDLFLNNESILERRRRQDELLNKKWKIFLDYRNIFNNVPFIDFVFISGSMALGNVHENSDFDLIIGCKTGRIFTVRFLLAFFFDLKGIRRTKTDVISTNQTRDKICLNHFVTRDSYCLNGPYHFQWQQLYLNLVPILGSKQLIDDFFNSNSNWLNGEPRKPFNYWNSNKLNFIQKFLKFILNGWFGDLFENLIKDFQIKRVEKNMIKFKNNNSRIKYNDYELEFHSDLTKINKILVD